MKLSLQVQYAVCGVFDLAYNGQGEPVQVRVISERQAIPGRYLEQIFRRLRQAELVTSKRGPGGGYTLARPPREITLREVIEAVEGPVEPALEAEPPGEASAALRPEFLWADLAERLASVLDEVDLESLCRDAVRAQVARANPDGPMYFI